MLHVVKLGMEREGKTSGDALVRSSPSQVRGPQHAEIPQGSSPKMTRIVLEDLVKREREKKMIKYRQDAMEAENHRLQIVVGILASLDETLEKGARNVELGDVSVTLNKIRLDTPTFETGESIGRHFYPNVERGWRGRDALIERSNLGSRAYEMLWDALTEKRGLTLECFYNNATNSVALYVKLPVPKEANIA